MKNILIYNSGGGLGDSIRLFTLITSLQNYFKKTEIYYLGAHQNHFLGSLKEYGIKIKTLDLGIKYFGFRWWHYCVAKRKFTKLGIDKFDLIIDLQSKIRNTIILNTIPSDNFYSTTYNFYFSTVKEKYISENESTNAVIKNLNTFLKLKINVMNYNFENVSSEYVKEAKRLLPNNSYIGFSLTQGNVYRKKSWPIEKFIRLANKIRTKNKVPVFFIQKDNYDLVNLIKDKVSNALFPEHYSSKSCPALVTALTCRLEKAVSIDNGIMHMMSLANVPLIVLFGPTNSQKFAPNGKNVTILDSNYLYKSNDISKISVEEVFKHI